MIRITDWHIVISGFTQHEGRMHGCLRLAQQLRALAAPHVFVGLREWDSDWARFAAFINLVSEWSDRDPRINVYAYSWGCGNGFVRLAEELESRGLSINHAVLCDPVYHSRVPTFLAKVIGVIRRGTIDVPANVNRVTWLRQRMNIPRGCDLRGRGPTIIDDAIELPRPHEQMDDAEEFHTLACQAAGLP